jgi:hypothetical protein
MEEAIIAYIRQHPGARPRTMDRELGIPLEPRWNPPGRIVRRRLMAAGVLRLEKRGNNNHWFVVEAE